MALSLLEIVMCVLLKKEEDINDRVFINFCHVTDM